MEYSSSKSNSNKGILHKSSGRSISSSSSVLSFIRSDYRSSSSSYVQLSVCPTSPSFAMSQRQSKNTPSGSCHKKSCMCSPTTHPGSFRCSLHKQASGSRSLKMVSYNSHRLNARISAMTNSRVRMGNVERDLVKRTLAALIRPSSNQQRRGGDFRQRPTRLSIMSKA